MTFFMNNDDGPFFVVCWPIKSYGKKNERCTYIFRTKQI